MLSNYVCMYVLRLCLYVWLVCWLFRWVQSSARIWIWIWIWIYEYMLYLLCETSSWPINISTAPCMV